MNNDRMEARGDGSPLQIDGERRLADVAQIAQVLEQQGRVMMRVRGSSMLPWIKAGDIAFIRRADINSLRCGDVVLFKRESRLFVHRLVEKHGTREEARFLAKGDAHPGPDGIVDRDLVLGRVARIYRNDKSIDLDSPLQLKLGLIISQLSRKSAYWYPIARAAAVLVQSTRRMILSAFRAPDNVPQ